jgi:hypothetical protein
MRTIHGIGGLILGRLVGRLLVRTKEGNGFGIRGGREVHQGEGRQVLSIGESRGLPLASAGESQGHRVRSELEEGRQVELRRQHFWLILESRTRGGPTKEIFSKLDSRTVESRAGLPLFVRHVQEGVGVEGGVGAMGSRTALWGLGQSEGS